MIFSARRKRGGRSQGQEGPHAILIASPDGPFAQTIGRAVSHWGYRPCYLEPGGGLAEDEIQAALLDIRDSATDPIGLVCSLRGRYPDIEVILINRPDNVASSIAGMQAGAMDEVIAPFDTEVLHQLLVEAVRRWQERKTPTRKSLLSRFSEAMMAATFAQAGEFDSALEMLDSSAPRRQAGGTAIKSHKQSGN